MCVLSTASVLGMVDFCLVGSQCARHGQLCVLSAASVLGMVDCVSCRQPVC